MSQEAHICSVTGSIDFGFYPWAALLRLLKGVYEDHGSLRPTGRQNATQNESRKPNTPTFFKTIQKEKKETKKEGRDQAAG